MERIIQINIASRVIPIEEDAYLVLKEYLNTLDRQFASEEGKDEIIQDIEHRIAELFSIRLQSGSPAIVKTDVQKVIDTLGHADELNENPQDAKARSLPTPYAPPYKQQESTGGQYQYKYTHQRLLRNPYDKIIGGVCSGMANYFDIDPVIVRLIFAALIFGVGVGFVAYIIAWIVIPAAKTPEELAYMSSGSPTDFETIKKNMADELQDLKKRGEQMSKELRDFFSKKK